MQVIAVVRIVAAAAAFAFANVNPNVIIPTPRPSHILPPRGWHNESTSSRPTRLPGCNENCTVFEPAFQGYTWTRVDASLIVYTPYYTTYTVYLDPSGISYSSELVTADTLYTNAHGTLICPNAITLWDDAHATPTVTTLAYPTSHFSYGSEYSWYGTFATTRSPGKSLCTTITSPIGIDGDSWATPTVTLRSHPPYQSPMVDAELPPGNGTVLGAVYTCMPASKQPESEFLKDEFPDDAALQVCAIGWNGGYWGAGALFTQSVVTDAEVGVTMMVAPVPVAKPTLPGMVDVTGVPIEGQHYPVQSQDATPGFLTIPPDSAHPTGATLKLPAPGSSTVVLVAPKSSPESIPLTIAVNAYTLPVLSSNSYAYDSVIITEVTIISGTFTSRTTLPSSNPTIRHSLTLTQYDPLPSQTAGLIDGSVVFTLISVTMIVSIATNCLPGLGATETITGVVGTGVSTHTVVMTMNEEGQDVLIVDESQIVVMPTGALVDGGNKSSGMAVETVGIGQAGGREGEGNRIKQDWDVRLLATVATVFLFIFSI